MSSMFFIFDGVLCVRAVDLSTSVRTLYDRMNHGKLITDYGFLIPDSEDSRCLWDVLQYGLSSVMLNPRNIPYRGVLFTHDRKIVELSLLPSEDYSKNPELRYTVINYRPEMRWCFGGDRNMMTAVAIALSHKGKELESIAALGKNFSMLRGRARDAFKVEAIFSYLDDIHEREDSPKFKKFKNPQLFHRKKRSEDDRPVFEMFYHAF